MPSTSSWSVSAQDTEATSVSVGAARRSPVILTVGACGVPPCTTRPNISERMARPGVLTTRATRTPSEEIFSACTVCPVSPSTGAVYDLLPRTMTTRWPCWLRSTTQRSPWPSQLGEAKPSSLSPGFAGELSTGSPRATAPPDSGTE